MVRKKSRFMLNYNIPGCGVHVSFARNRKPLCPAPCRRRFVGRGPAWRWGFAIATTHPIHQAAQVPATVWKSRF